MYDIYIRIPRYAPNGLMVVKLEALPREEEGETRTTLRWLPTTMCFKA